jgi:serine-type D-Ala-D-Ala carboxypeptidase/endopeptidase
MMQKLLAKTVEIASSIIGCIAGAIGWIIPVQAQPITSEAEIRQLLQQRVEQEQQAPGMVVGLIDRTGRRVIAYGVGDRTSLHPVDGQTIFEIGSISKVFTALALTTLADRGELSLQDPISKFLPAGVKLPTRNGQEISLLSLATHTSGLPRLPGNLAPADDRNPYADYTLEQLYTFLSGYSLPRAIGAEYEYSNLGAGLLGHLLGLRAGTTYENLIKTQITQPLQMPDTVIQLSTAQQTRFATGHTGLGQPTAYWDLPTLAGAGGLRSTVNDLLTFLAANLQFTSSPLAARLQTMQTVQVKTPDPTMAMAIGWHVLRQPGGNVIFHDGGTGGFRSFIGFVPQRGLGVVVLANSENDVTDLGLHLLDRRNPLPKRTPPKQRRAIAVNPQLFNDYVGQYQLTADFILTVSTQQNRLYLQASGQPQVELLAESETQFFIQEVDAQVTFMRDRQGRVKHLILHQTGQNLPAPKIN